MTSSSTVDTRVGVIGGGQLGRMMAEAAAPLGVELVVLDPTPDAPASPVAREQIVASFDDRAAIEELASKTDVLTFEIELAEPDVLEVVAEETGTSVHPSPETLRVIQDKLVQKRSLEEAGIPVPPFAQVDSVEDLEAACDRFGYPCMLKARTGGYDGRGNVPLPDPEHIPEAFAAIDAPAMVEAFVDYEREISVIGVKGAEQREQYVPGENIHEEEILRETIAPARISSEVQAEAERTAGAVLDHLEGRGVYGIELFETSEGEVLVNEIAPRPHNSGHWTIEGAVTSQFEQHVRAILGQPLGATTLRSPIVTANLLGDGDASRPARPHGIQSILRADDAHLHWYGKDDVRPLRKMGHVAVHDPGTVDRAALLEAARTYAAGVTFQPKEV